MKFKVIAIRTSLPVGLTGPRMAAVVRALSMEKGTLSKTFHSLANHPLLLISIRTRVAIALGIIFLKTTKPNLGGSMVILGVAIVSGLASALYMPRRDRVQEGSAD